MIIDAHHYFQGKAPSKHDGSGGNDKIRHKKEYGHGDQGTTSLPPSINGMVAIQEVPVGDETDYLARLADNNSMIRGVIGITDLESDYLPERLDYLRQHKILKGFRNPGSDKADSPQLHRGIIRGVKVLKVYNFTFDLRVNISMMEEVIQFIDELPDVRIALDFTGSIEEGKLNLADWDNQLRELASFSGIMCKITGLAGKLSAGSDRFILSRRYIDSLFDAFGPGRIIFGTGWPATGNSLGYNEIIEINRNLTAGFSDQENEMIYFKNAANFYKLDIPIK